MPLVTKLIAFLAAVLVAASVARAQDPELQIKEVELERVRAEISDLKESMDRRAGERNRVTGELQTAEVAIGAKRIALQDIERRRQFSEKRVLELAQGIAQREEELSEESEQLGEQVRAAYVNGGQERIKLMLNQQDPAGIGRLLKYYEYLSDFRARNIEAVTRALDELQSLKAEAGREQAEIARLADSREAELQALGRAQEERKRLLAALNRQLESEGSEIERLAAQEKDLARLVAELTSILSDYPISSEDPFTTHKGLLTWPVAGQLLHDYGDARGDGQLSWNGVVLAAPRGREVRAVYHGRVVFADWLAGMGLLVIVDHGEGYLTLYGYNETVLKSPGDWVAPGDVIATVGDSGGQPQAGLYFEVRQGTKPVNPRAWVSRQPTRG